MKNIKSKKASQPLTISNIVVLFCGVVVGFIHLLQPDTLLKLNGLGYVILAFGTVFKIKGVESFLEAAPKMLIAYAVTTICLYFVLMGDAATDNTVGLITKMIELILIGMLVNKQRAQKQESKRWIASSGHHLMSKGESW